MHRICLCLAFVFLLTGCGRVVLVDSPEFNQDDQRLMKYNPAAYDKKYNGTEHERQAFDESTWDRIEAELRERPR